MKCPIKRIVFSLCCLIVWSSYSISHADDQAVIIIKEHQFIPAELKVPSGKKIKLIVQNQDNTQEEFESYDLNREEIIDGGGSLEIFIGPLKPGRYAYFGEFNPDTAQGTIIAE